MRGRKQLPIGKPATQPTTDRPPDLQINESPSKERNNDQFSEKQSNRFDARPKTNIFAPQKQEVAQQYKQNRSHDHDILQE